MRETPTPGTINNILLYLDTGNKHNSHPNCFTQQLMETDAETQSRTFGGVQRILWGKGIGRIERAREVKDTTRKTTESTNLGT